VEDVVENDNYDNYDYDAVDDDYDAFKRLISSTCTNVPLSPSLFLSFFLPAEAGARRHAQLTVAT